jgi:hypothetical protein
LVLLIFFSFSRYFHHLPRTKQKHKTCSGLYVGRNQAVTRHPIPTLAHSLIHSRAQTARKIGVELIPRMDAALRQEESAKRPPLGFFAR